MNSEKLSKILVLRLLIKQLSYNVGYWPLVKNLGFIAPVNSYSSITG